MLRNIDLFFHYKFVGRNILLNKSSWKSVILNNYKIPKLKYLIIGFEIKDSTDYYHFLLFSYIYFFGFFFGRSCYISRYGHRFHRGSYYFTYRVQSVLNFPYLYYYIFYLLNDLKSKINKEFISLFHKVNTSSLVISYMTLFIEKKNNIALFKLQGKLIFSFFYEGCLVIKGNRLLEIFKII